MSPIFGVSKDTNDSGIGHVIYMKLGQTAVSCHTAALEHRKAPPIRKDI